MNNRSAVEAPWPAGAGEMARRIRVHDWAATPLGASALWPERLRSVTELVLASGFPMVVLWGPELIQIYNDGCSALMGAKHPKGLGQPARDCWPEARHVTEPIYTRVGAGETVTFEDALHPLARHGAVENAWFTLSFAPLPDGAGPTGVLVTIFETSARHKAEQALRESEARFRALATAGTYMMYRMSPDWRLMYQLHGRDFLADTAEPVADWADSYLLPEDRPAIFAAIEEAIRTKSLFEMEHRVRRADGGVGWVVSRAVPILGTDGEIVEWFGAGSDVTARREAAERLRESEERQAFLLKLADTLGPLADPAEIQGEACRLLAEMLDAERAYYVEVDEAAGVARVERDFVRGGAPSIAGEQRVADFAWSAAILQNGERYAIDDTQRSASVSEADRSACAALRIIACAGAPLIKQGRLVGTLCVTSPRPRNWSEGEVALLREVGERVWAAVERARAEAAMRESEGRFRSFAENSSDVLWIVNADSGQLEYLSPSFAAMWGESRERVMADIGRWMELVHPDDREKASLAMRRSLEGETVMQSYRIVRPHDGAERWIQDTGFPIRDERGRITRIGGVSQDLTERTRTELEVRARRRELRTLVESIPQLVWRAVDGGEWTWASPQWTRFTGQSEKASHSWGWLEPVHPDDREKARAAWRQAEAQGRFEADYRLRRSDGAYRWFQTRATSFQAEDGSPADWFGTSTDIDDIRRLQEHEKVLLSELQHRVRNTLAVIRSIVRRTGRTARSVDDYAMHVEGRIDAFARVQASVTRDPTRGLDLEYLIAEELRGVGAREGPNISIGGPPVAMTAKAAETFGLAVHELATNALKHGALTSPGGRIDVAWSLEGENGGLLDFRWRERGTPLDRPQQSRRGFGTEILNRTLGYELKARTETSYHAEGLACRITLPLAEILMPEEPVGQAGLS